MYVKHKQIVSNMCSLRTLCNAVIDHNDQKNTLITLLVIELWHSLCTFIPRCEERSK